MLSLSCELLFFLCASASAVDFLFAVSEVEKIVNVRQTSIIAGVESLPESTLKFLKDKNHASSKKMCSHRRRRVSGVSSVRAAP
ncbi:exported hypothetical protein [Syntrophobacter sp. SbD1]|nr:exported hypothetical protein [Syntrophobacter sp. SbD1]